MLKVLMTTSTFKDQSMSIGCVGKLRHQSGFLRHYLLNATCLWFDLGLYDLHLKEITIFSDKEVY